MLPDGSWDLQSGDTCRKEARGINMPTSLSHLLPDLLLSPLADPTGTRARELIEAGHQVTLLRHETGRGESRVDMEEQMGETYFQNILRISMPLHLPGTASSDPPIVSAAPHAHARSQLLYRLGTASRLPNPFRALTLSCPDPAPSQNKNPNRLTWRALALQNLAIVPFVSSFPTMSPFAFSSKGHVLSYLLVVASAVPLPKVS